MTSVLTQHVVLQGVIEQLRIAWESYCGRCWTRRSLLSLKTVVKEVSQPRLDLTESSSHLTRCNLTVNDSAPEGGVAWSHPHGSTILADHNEFIVDRAAQATPAAVAQEFFDCTIEHGGLNVRLEH